MNEPVIFEGRPLKIGDQVRAKDMPLVVVTVEGWEVTHLGIYFALSQGGSEPIPGYRESNWTRVSEA